MMNRLDDERVKLYRIAGTGFDFFGSVLGGVMLGYLLDWWLKTAPVFLLIGLGIGFAMGLYKLVRLLQLASNHKK